MGGGAFQRPLSLQSSQLVISLANGSGAAFPSVYVRVSIGATIAAPKRDSKGQSPLAEGLGGGAFQRPLSLQSSQLVISLANGSGAAFPSVYVRVSIGATIAAPKRDSKGQSPLAEGLGGGAFQRPLSLALAILVKRLRRCRRTPPRVPERPPGRSGARLCRRASSARPT